MLLLALPDRLHVGTQNCYRHKPPNMLNEEQAAQITKDEQSLFMKQHTVAPLGTVGDILYLLQDIPPNTPLHAQIQSPDGSAWNMYPFLCARVPNGLGACIVLTPILNGGQSNDSATEEAQ